MSTWKNNTERLESRDMSDILNFVFNDDDSVKRLMDVHRYVSKTASLMSKPGIVSVLIMWLGKQDYQWTGRHRYHVYDRPLYRIMANNYKGLSFSIATGSNRDQVLAAIDQICLDLNQGPDAIQREQTAGLLQR